MMPGTHDNSMALVALDSFSRKVTVNTIQSGLLHIVKSTIINAHFIRSERVGPPPSI
jgi:hypothetical protein